MALLSCNGRCNCSLAAVIASVIIGVVTAFLQITGAVTVTPVFLWAVLGVALVFLAVLLATAVFTRQTTGCVGTALGVLLTGVLGTVFFGVILLAFGVVATSVISAILAGLLLASFSLTIGGAVCFVNRHIRFED